MTSSDSSRNDIFLDFLQSAIGFFCSQIYLHDAARTNRIKSYTNVMQCFTYSYFSSNLLSSRSLSRQSYTSACECQMTCSLLHYQTLRDLKLAYQNTNPHISHDSTMLSFCYIGTAFAFILV